MNAKIVKSKKLVSCLALSIFILFSFMVTTDFVYAQASGRITGKVVEAGTKAALPGANVIIVGTNMGAATDRQGYFIISKVPPGMYELSVSFIGYEKSSQMQVKVVANEVTTVDFELKYSAIEVSEVEVSAARLSYAQSTALHTQREAANIKNVVASDLIGTFPDINASETLARVPAIAITRDHGEGRFAIVRGIRPEYNSTEINGERIPSAEKEVRTVALDVVPADMIQTVEVTKALTADKDGDAIGGNINLIMKDAPDRRMLNVTLGYGLNGRQGIPDRKNNRRDINQLNIITGDSFVDGKFGYLVSGSYYNTFLKTANREYRFSFGNEGSKALSDGTARWETRDYEVNRIRAGVNGSLLYKPALGHKFYFRALYNRFSDQEFRHRIQRRYDKKRITRALKDRLEIQTIENYTIGAEHTLANGINIDYHYAYTRSHEDRPDEHNTDFTLKFDDFASTSNLAGVEGMEFGGLIAPKDPLGFSFDQDEIQNLNLKDRDHVAVLNALLPFTGESVYGNVKFGFKGRFKDRISDHSGLIMEAGDEDFYLPGGLQTSEFPPKATDCR
ncbi:MAG: carboxypeptidase-like regulatory domain-containing protein, partial [bacterium]